MVCSVMRNLYTFIPHLTQMGKEGMSDDEDAHEDGMRVYESGIPHWRSDEITIYLRILDLLHLSTKFDLFGTAAPGNWPRVRVPSQRVVEKRPVGRLPKNFYNQAWLQTLTAKQQEELDMSPSVRFEHSEEDMK